MNGVEKWNVNADPFLCPFPFPHFFSLKKTIKYWRYQSFFPKYFLWKILPLDLHAMFWEKGPRGPPGAVLPSAFVVAADAFPPWTTVRYALPDDGKAQAPASNEAQAPAATAPPKNIITYEDKKYNNVWGFRHGTNSILINIYFIVPMGSMNKTMADKKWI